jgi:cell division protein FtsB
MAKALFGHLGGDDLQIARLASDNAVLRARVATLSAQIDELREALSAATAVADGRLVDLVTETANQDLDVALREVTAATV